MRVQQQLKFARDGRTKPKNRNNKRDVVPPKKKQKKQEKIKCQSMPGTKRKMAEEGIPHGGNKKRRERGCRPINACLAAQGVQGRKNIGIPGMV